MSEERSFAAVLRDILQGVAEIIRSEVRLAKTEMLDDAKATVASLRWVAAGVVLAGLAATCLVWAAVFALSLVMALWAAALLVAIVLGLVSVAMVDVGLRRLHEVRMVPPRTVATVMENGAWVKQFHR